MLCPNTTKQKHHGYGHSQGWSSAGTLYSTDTVECGNPFTCTREGVQDFLLYSIFCHVPPSRGLEFLTTKILKLEGLFLAVNYRKKNNALLKSSGSMVLYGSWFSAILQNQSIYWTYEINLPALTRTVRSTRDGEQTTTTLAKRILYVLLLPWNLNVLTTYLGDFKLHTFQYAEYYGDGDDKSFSKVENVYQASGITVKKKTALVMCRKGWAQLFAS